jgi:hypothetical protein
MTSRTNNFSKVALSVSAASAIAIFGSSCNSTTSVSGLLSAMNATVTTATNGDLVASVSAQLDTSDYGVAELNVNVIDPSNPALTYGTVNITPTVCSGTTTCINGGILTLSLDLSSFVDLTGSNTELPNGTPFPVSFSNAATKLVAVNVGNGGAKVYVALGGGTYFVGAAIPFNGLTGAGKYTPGLDVFATVTSNNINGYIGVFAGAATSVDQTGVGVFADLSSLITSTTTAIAAKAEARSSQLIPSKNAKSSEDNFLYHLWKTGHEDRPTLRYE